MFEPLQKFIPKTANHYGVSGVMQAAKICHDFRESIPEFFAGKTSAVDSIDAAYYKKGTLYVNVSSPAWSQEVIMRKPEIIDELNRRAGRQIVKNLRTKLRDKSAS